MARSTAKTPGVEKSSRQPLNLAGSGKMMSRRRIPGGRHATGRRIPTDADVRIGVSSYAESFSSSSVALSRWGSEPLDAMIG